MKETREEPDYIWRIAPSLFSDAYALINEGAKAALSHLPELEESYRGHIVVFRYPKKSVDVALALKIVQLKGNIHACMLLIEKGFFFELDVVKRVIQDAVEDVNFLVFHGEEESKLVDRYLDAFFDEDFDKDGKLTNRKKVGGVVRGDVRKVLTRAYDSSNLTEKSNGHEAISRGMHRVRSGSVHGSAASIIRAYLDESNLGQLRVSGERASIRTNFEYVSLLLEQVACIVATVIVAGSNRWWDEKFLNRANNLNEQLRSLLESAKDKGMLANMWLR